MKIVIAQINPIIGDVSYNKKKILQYIEDAKSKKAHLLLFPELALCGYPPEDLLLQKSFVSTCEKELLSLASHTQHIAVVIGGIRINPQLQEKPFFNTAAIFENGKFLGYQDKSLLPTYDVFDERRYFEPGKSSNLWNLCGKKVGITICEDIWQHSGVEYTRYVNDPISRFAVNKPDLLLNLSASPFSMERDRTREDVAQKVVQSLQLPLVLCNQVGAQDGLIFDGNSFALHPQGKILAQGAAFQEDLVVFEVENSPLCTSTFTEQEQGLYDALVLGIRDYFSKQGFTKACLGLSGGIDSAVVAILAVAALGKENVLALLLPSRFTAAQSFKDAYSLAASLPIATREISIEPLQQLFLETLEPHFKHLPADITEENLQARIRGTLLMAFSNKLGYLLLSTANKSELAMGYSTLYGDMCGALSVIGDLTKGNVYRLARWIQQEKGIHLQDIIDREPTAELKENQKDSDTLPPYSLLDAVIQDYVEEEFTIEAIADKQKLPVSLVQNLIQRLHKNEYKRRQAPLILRVTKKALTVGRKVPIVHHWDTSTFTS